MVFSMAVYTIAAIITTGYQIELYQGQSKTLLTIVMFVVALYAHIIIHEGGHLVFGLLTGYGFLSFRIGSFVFQKNNGKMEVKRNSLASTGGQCLLSAPDYNDGNYPYFWYNAGGVIFNLVFAILSLVIATKTKNVKFISLFFFTMFTIGLTIAITNGVPMKTKMISNDAKNILDMSKDELTKKCDWLILKIYGTNMEGTRLKDMPDEWFDIENSENNNDLINNVRCYKATRYLDNADWENAEKYMDEILDNGLLTSSANYYLMYLDRLTLQLVKDAANTDVSVLQQKDFKSFIKSMRFNPTVIRTQYAIEKLKNKNDEAANKIAEEFEKVKKTYPIQADLETEQLIWNLINNKAKEN